MAPLLARKLSQLLIFVLVVLSLFLLVDGQKGASNSSKSFGTARRKRSSEPTTPSQQMRRRDGNISHGSGYGVRAASITAQSTCSSTIIDPYNPDWGKGWTSEGSSYGIPMMQADNPELLTAANTDNVLFCLAGYRLDPSHPDMPSNITGCLQSSGRCERDYIQPGILGYVGTIAASIIGGRKNNVGMIGVFPDAQIYVHGFSSQNAGPDLSLALYFAWEDCLTELDARKASKPDLNMVVVTYLETETAGADQFADYAQSLRSDVQFVVAVPDGGYMAVYLDANPTTLQEALLVSSVDHNKKWVGDIDIDCTFPLYWWYYPRLVASSATSLAAPGWNILAAIPTEEEADGEYYHENMIFTVTPAVQSAQADLWNTPPPELIAWVASPTNVAAEVVLDDPTASKQCENADGKFCLLEYALLDGRSMYGGVAGYIYYYEGDFPVCLRPDVPYWSDNLVPEVIITFVQATALKAAIANGTVTVAISWEPTSPKPVPLGFFTNNEFATAMAAGAIGMLWSIHPKCTAWEIRAAVKATADASGTSIDTARKIGKGIPQVLNAHRYLETNGCASDCAGNPTALQLPANAASIRWTCPTRTASGRSCTSVQLQCSARYTAVGSASSLCTNTQWGQPTSTLRCISEGAAMCTGNPALSVQFGGFDCGQWTPSTRNCTAECTYGATVKPTAVCLAGRWSAISGSCNPPPNPNRDKVFVTSTLDWDISVVGNCSDVQQGKDILGTGIAQQLRPKTSSDVTVAVSIGNCRQQNVARDRRSRPAPRSTRTSNLTGLLTVNIRVTEAVDRVVAALPTFRAASNIALEALRAGLLANCLAGSLSPVITSFQRATRARLDQEATIRSLNSSMTNATQQAATGCPAGQFTYTPDRPGPCYYCVGNTYNPAWGGTCEPCVANSKAIDSSVDCYCNTGYKGVYSTINLPGFFHVRLEACVADGLRCTVNNSQLNAVETGCECKPGYIERLHPSTRQVLECVPLDCIRKIPGSQLNSFGMACVCKSEFLTSYVNGSLVCAANCSSIANSQPGVRGTEPVCECGPGYTAQNNTAGMLVSCTKQQVTCNITDSQLNANGTTCECTPGYTPQYDIIGALTACVQEAPQPRAVDDTATAVAGSYTNISVLQNDISPPTRILTVRGSARATVRRVAGTNGTDIISYVARPFFSGVDTFWYTTEAGTAAVKVQVAPYPCTDNACGLQGQSGACRNGRCVCAQGSGMTSTYIANPVASKRAVTPQVPACRYQSFTPVGNFSMQGMTAAPGSQLNITFALARSPALASCFEVQPVANVTLGRLKDCPAAGRSVTQQQRSAGVVGTAQIAPVTSSCANGTYMVAINVPNRHGWCYTAALRLMDGTARRFVLQVAP